MRLRPPPRTFKSGELAPWLDGISSPLTADGCRNLENFIVKKQGQAVRRPGTFFVATTKSNGAAVLIPVVIDDTHRYILEVGDIYIRVYDEPTHAYNSTEIVSPWSGGELSTLCWKYVPNEHALYLAQSAHPLNRLVWTSGTSWSIQAVPIMHAPAPIVINSLGRLASSTDLKTWQEARIDIDGPPITAVYTAIARGRNAVVATRGIGGVAEWNEGTTLDNWIALATSSSGPAALAFDVDATPQGEMVGVKGAGDTSGVIYYSNDDGETWSNLTGVPSSSSILYAVSHDQGRQHWMAVGSGKRVYSYGLEDGFTSVAETGILYDVAYGSNLWVAVGASVIHTYGSVADGITSVTMTGTLYGITHGSPAGSDLWIAVGTTSSGAAVIYSSPTGTVWTQRYNDNTYAGALTDVKWLGHMFLAVGHTPNAGALPTPAAGAASGTLWITSYDGLTWTVDATLSRSKTHGWYKIAYRDEVNVSDLNTSTSFPRVIGQHEGRLITVPSDKGARLLGSSAEDINNFHLGKLASDAYQYDLVGDGNVDIQWIMGGFGGLVIGTRTAEGIVLGSPDEGITPLTAQFRWLSTFGSTNVQPIRIHDTIVFVQRGGEIVRGYVPAATAYQSPELTEHADHITSGGIIELDHQDDPQSLIYALRSDGQLPVLAFGDGLRAWSRIKAAPSSAAAATIESVAVIPTNDAEDEVWQIVKRTIGGGTVRHIEYYSTLAPASFTAAHYLDDGVYVTSGTTIQTIGSLTHLAAESVDAFISAPAANIRWIQGLTVAASGTINVAPYSGTDIHVGLPYTSYLQTLRSDPGGPQGSSAGINKRTSTLTLWVSAASALAKFGPTTITAVETLANLYSSSTTLVTEEIHYPFPGQFDRDNYIWCIVSDPRPFTLVAMLADTEIGDY